tara:strand:- start:237 stop:1163 length:927 start_codon:yes stop_codon:yes gene_type:complete
MVNKIKLYSNLKIKAQHKGSILLIGNFDGLHLGHQKLFRLAKKFKKKYNLKIGVMSFDPMPKMFFNKNLKNFKISNLSQKIALLKKLSVDFIINLKFNKKFSEIKSIDFIKKILAKKVCPKFIFVSNNFRYGNKREGDVKELVKNETKYDFKIVKPKPFIFDKRIVSSTLIRKYLQNGKIQKANKLLNRNWSIIGKVQKGRKLGKKIGFPTANIDIKNYILARPGVYSVRIRIGDNINYLTGVANLGYRPTFNEQKILLEVHLFNFSGNLYNKYLTVEFLKFIRKEKKFKNVEQLKKQIKKDVKTAKK